MAPKPTTQNTLFYGDNLDILRRHIADESVDLIYLDPPFNSNQDYNVLFAEQDGSRSAAQIKAFGDTWRWDQQAETIYREVVENGGKASQALQGFRYLLGNNDMLAYLSMMAPRLIELRRVLKSSGSIYLHCDTTASAYLRILMDMIFGSQCFRNEIIWSYRRWPSPSNHFQRMHDVILFYSKTAPGPETFNVTYEPNSPSYEKRFKGKTQMLDPETKTRKITLESNSKGLPQRDVWEISIIAGYSKERLGYPTQKPLTLLERIVEASSNPGDIVLDPFCGCGTTIAAAQKLNRKWIGIDITSIAINLIKTRLLDIYGEEIIKTYMVRGEPTTFSEAKALAEQDKYQFQWWALGLVGARGVEEKKGADQGIDGRLYFHDEAEGNKTKQVIFSVKGGHTSVRDIRDLRGVIEREKAEIGVLLTLQDSTQPMRTEAAGAGFYTSPWGKHSRLQIITIAELLNNKRVDMPPLRQVNITFKKAPKARGEEPETPMLPM